MLVGRSFKYHRPRGIVASGAEEPNALVSLGSGGRFEPNQRATTTELFDGLEAASQNHWPSLEFDVGVVNNLSRGFCRAGSTTRPSCIRARRGNICSNPSSASRRVWARRPRTRDADRYEHAYAFCDVLVAGGGMAGLQAALMPRVRARG